GDAGAGQAWGRWQRMSRNASSAPAAIPPWRITGDDLYLFNEGSHFTLYDKLGAHTVEEEGVRGVRFAMWAPNAERVSIVGDFNGWDTGANPMSALERSGIW